MERELTIVLVEDDAKTCEDFRDYVDSLDDVTLAGITNDASKALEMIYAMLPDAVILDLELHNGSVNGLFLLQEVKRIDLTRMPYILITTNNSSQVTYESARALGADFILSKHQSDYSPKQAVDFLRMIKDVIQSTAFGKAEVSPSEESPAQKSRRISKRICAELNAIGISTKAIGYQYLVDSIQLVMAGPVNNLSTIVGDKYHKTSFSVERAMQNAIARAWKTMPIDDLLANYTAHISTERGVPTVTEFIYYYANKLKNEQ